jgi:hypothetical protein
MTPMPSLHHARLAGLGLLAALILAAAPQAGAADQRRARDLVDRIRQPDPPAVSTTTTRMPVVVPMPRPQPPSMKMREPPPPRIGNCHSSHGWRTRQALGC